MIITVCALQIASIPAASSDWMARMWAVRVIVWIGGIVQLAKISDLLRY
jgi:hypothetical protein